MSHTVKTAFLNELHYLPNGGVAVLDAENKMVAYNRSLLEQDGKFDWVRKDCRKGVDKNRK